MRTKIINGNIVRVYRDEWVIVERLRFFNQGGDVHFEVRAVGEDVNLIVAFDDTNIPESNEMLWRLGTYTFPRSGPTTRPHHTVAAVPRGFHTIDILAAVSGGGYGTVFDRRLVVEAP